MDNNNQDNTQDKPEDQLLVLARQFVEMKVPFADDDMKEDMAQETRQAIGKTIRLELVSAMNPQQIGDYEELLSQDNVTDEIVVAFINKCGINIDEITQRALTKFRMAYLGA